MSSRGFTVSFADESSGTSWKVTSQGSDLQNIDWSSDFVGELSEALISGLSLGSMAEDPQYFVDYVVGSATGLIAASIGRPFYMPASRSGVLLGHRVLSSLIVRQASLAWTESRELPRLPGAITDFIEVLLQIEPRQTDEGGIEDVARFIEQQVTRGRIDIDLQATYPETRYADETGEYAVHQVSSMIAEIAPIVLYLRHLIEVGDLLIIEEPESHLDARNQGHLARAIAMLVNAGVKVLITTHSDFFVNQLSNLLMLSQFSGKRRPKRYKKNEVLDPDDVGAYYFDPTADGTIVRKLTVTPDNGIPTEPFTKVHRELYDEAVEFDYAQKN